MPRCHECGQDHEYAWVHCRACVSSKTSPGDLSRVAEIGDLREYYCAFCGRFTVATENVPRRPKVQFPEGLPVKELVRGPASRPGRYVKLLGLHEYHFEAYDPYTGLFTEHTRMIRKPQRLRYPDGWPKDQLLVVARRVDPEGDPKV